jgi:hypothetical protein
MNQHRRGALGSTGLTAVLLALLLASCQRGDKQEPRDVPWGESETADTPTTRSLVYPSRTPAASRTPVPLSATGPWRIE